MSARTVRVNVAAAPLTLVMVEVAIDGQRGWRAEGNGGRIERGGDVHRVADVELAGAGIDQVRAALQGCRPRRC